MCVITSYSIHYTKLYEYGKVVAYEPDNSAAKLSLAVARYRANPVDSDLRTKARGGLEGALEADPSNVMALEQLAFIRTEESDHFV